MSQRLSDKYVHKMTITTDVLISNAAASSISSRMILHAIKKEDRA